MLNSKMKGIVDPFTLGILIAIAGTIVVNIIHGDLQADQQKTIPMDAEVLTPDHQSRPSLRYDRSS